MTVSKIAENTHGAFLDRITKLINLAHLSLVIVR
jgi:hypothetical protein